MATLNETFTNIANAIRNKTGDTATMTPAEMVTAISNISGKSSESDITFSTVLSPTSVDLGADSSATIPVDHSKRFFAIIYNDANSIRITNCNILMSNDALYLVEASSQTSNIIITNTASYRNYVVYGSFTLTIA